MILCFCRIGQKIWKYGSVQEFDEDDLITFDHLLKRIATEPVASLCSHILAHFVLSANEKNQKGSYPHVLRSQNKRMILLLSRARVERGVD
jgi:hypothetical protein